MALMDIFKSSVQKGLIQDTKLPSAYSNYQTHIFLADELFSAPLPGDEPEALETISWPLADLDALRRQENFSDSRSVLATFLIAEELINE